jgi:O-antigen/teichoic acid export membrane protein
MPIISELHSKRELVQLGRFYQVTTKWIFAFNLPLFLIVLLFSRYIMLIFGNDFVAGATGLVILSVGNLIDAGTGINGEMILMTGNAWLNTINTVIALTLQLTLSFLLIPMWGVVGAAIAVAVATSALNIIRTIEVFVTMRFLPYNKSFVKPVVAGVAAALATRGMAQWFLARGDLISTGLNIGFLLITYAAMILILGLSEEDQMVITRLRGRLTAILPGQ